MTATRTALVPAPADARTTDPGRELPGRAVQGRRRPQVATATALASLIAVSVLLRLEGAGVWLWIDEALTVGLAQQPITEIPSMLRLDGSPPLYYLVLHVWLQLFGSGEAASHALSLVFATLSIPVAFWAGSSLFDRRTAWIGAVLAATSPFLTHFANETRMYSLVTLLAIVVSAAFVHAFIRGTDRALAVFVGALVALLYTHNWGIYLAVAAAVALLPALLAAEHPRKVLRRGLFAFGAVGLAYLPWAFVLVGQVGSTGAPWSFTPGARQVVAEVAALVRDERVLFVLLAVVPVGILELLRRPRSADGATAWALVFLVALPIGLGWAVSHIEPSWATRYLAVVVGPLLLLAARGLARAGTAGVLALLIAVALWVQPLTRLQGNLDLDRAGKSDAKALAASIDQRLEDGDLVIVAQPEAVPLFAHYVQDDVRFATLWGEVDRPMVMDWRDAEERLRTVNVDEHLLPLIASLEPGDRIALVGPGGRLVPTDTDWIRSFHRLHSEWRQTLTSGPSTVLVDRIRSTRQEQVDPADATAGPASAIEAGPGPGSETDVPVASPFTARVYEVVAPG